MVRKHETQAEMKYIISGFDSYNDVALLKFDRPIYQKDWNWKSRTNAIYPICLPDKSYREIGKISKLLSNLGTTLPWGWLSSQRFLLFMLEDKVAYG